MMCFYGHGHDCEMVVVKNIINLLAEFLLFSNIAANLFNETFLI